ncbi:hypothetical protein H9P43_005383 [Blastocladiella emersonii ATCC 22665]|nr:hypothetical protein H9P43_005383 [Blastocladiella emersonii ATCC 22665]
MDAKYAKRHDKRRAFARQANSCVTRSRLHAMIKNTLRGLAARVVAGLKHAPGCTCESEFEDWNLKYKLGIKDIEAFDKELTKALQTIRKPFKEKAEWVDLKSLTKQWLVGEAPEELHRATLAMVDEYDDAELDMDFADTDLDAAMSVRACRGAHPLYSSHAKLMAGYAIVNDLKLLDINKPFPIDGSSPVWRVMAAVAVLCAWRITGSAYQQGIIVGLTKEDAKVTLADYYDAFPVSSTGSVSVVKRIYLASQLRALFKRGILNISLAEIAQQNTGVETTKTQAAMTVDIANDICPDE